MRPAWQEGKAPASGPRLRLDVWSLFLFLTLALVPVVVPTGPAQSAIVDVLNLVALPAFAASILLRRRVPHVPFVIPIFLIAVGSIAATLNAISVPAALLAMVQDLYLFLWFLMIVNLLREGRDLTAFRVTWTWVAVAISLWGLGVIMVRDHQTLDMIIRPRGSREISTFYDPNMCADYLVLSLFMVLSLGEEVGKLFRWGAIAALLLGIIATKSNGGLTSLAVGSVVWLLARAWTARIPAAGVAALGLLGATALLGGFLLVRGFGVGESQLAELGSHSVLGRASHSSEGRFAIWNALLHSYAQEPIGIGPGNSSEVQLNVELRERPNSIMSKEAHNDYLAYLIERGPLALLGLIVLKFQVFGKITGWWRRRRQEGFRTGGALTASALAALAAASMHSFTLETLHFRHEWLFLAMVCALDRMVFRARREERPGDLAEATGRRMAVAAA